MRVTPCEPEHVQMIAPQRRQSGDLKPFFEAIDAQRDDLGKLAWTLWDGETPVGVMGLVFLRDGLYEAWGLYSQDAVTLAPKTVARAAYRGLLHAEVTLHPRRIQAFLRPGDEIGERWLRFLHFEREGLLRAYAQDGSDMVLYARIPTYPQESN